MFFGYAKDTRKLNLATLDMDSSSSENPTPDQSPLKAKSALPSEGPTPDEKLQMQNAFRHCSKLPGFTQKRAIFSFKHTP